MKSRLLLVLPALALGACTSVGPDYRSPAPDAPAQADFSGAASPLFTGEEPPGRWWRLFEDPLLDRLVEQALAENRDLRVASANLARARAVLRETRSGRLPSTDLAAGVIYGDTPGPGGAGASYDAGLDVGYQVDLFGRLGRAIEAGRADVEAVQAGVDLARVTIAAETIRAYADACHSGRRLAVARESLRLQEATFDLTRRLFAGGRATALETSQAGAQLDQTRSAIPLFEAARQTALYRLSVLTGRPPDQFPEEAAACATPLALDRPIPVGNGASLLARRPDLRAAERELAAATARIGVATADLYPSISLGGSIGSTASSLGGLASGDGLRFSLGPLISWSFPNVARARARIAQAEAGADAALARFEGSWLAALEETESALTRYARELDRVAALRSAQANGREAARIARLRYEAGREGFQIVLEAERSLAQTESLLAEAEAQLSDHLVSLFLALGGGWQA